LGAFGSLACFLTGRLLFKLREFVFLGNSRWNTELGEFSHGFQHGFFCSELPTRLVDILVENGGGICAHKSMVSGSLIHYCQKVGLQVWVFTAKKPVEYFRYSAIQGIDVVFSDQPSEVLEELARLSACG